MAAPAGRSPELAEILRAHAPPLEHLGHYQRRVVRDIINCRTAVLGGHLQVCDRCGHQTPVYNSCRNRHCPKCQNLDQARWVQARRRDLLPVPYFHVVFTVPPSLHPFFLADRRRSYDLLFATAMEALHAVCRRRLGLRPGTVAILHTWSQTLLFHPHLHCIVTGGGLNAAADRWVAARPNFLVPVRALSRVFRGKLLHRLAGAIPRGSLRPAGAAGLRQLRQAAAREWVVYSKPPLAGPAQVLRYLSRYTHRIAIGNERLLALHQQRVTFAYRDRRRGGRRRRLTIAAREFTRRFLLHIVPHGFVRVRHFGLQANGCRRTRLDRARELLGSPVLPTAPEPVARPSWKDLYREITGRDPDLCPECGRGLLRVVAFLPPHHAGRGP
ncbi:MAG TPA: IS91 family transposase [Thermoanaerobaculia bacterium]|nr:IS91 family transposase [Thermoanaerobaculia bacterium]